MRLYEIQQDERSEQLFATNLPLIEQNCMEAIWALQDGRTIYKGMNLSGNFYKSNPKLHIRKSQNTSNYYTLLLSNLPNWKNFPPRSQSLICSTSYRKAQTYGNVFIVLPFDGAKIGVCPDSDIFFTKNYDYYSNLDIVDLNNFWASLDFNDFDYLWFLRQFENNYMEIIGILLNGQSVLGNSYAASELGEQMKGAPHHTKEDKLKFLMNLYDPEKNGFILSSVDKLPIGENNEVWTDSESYLLRKSSTLCSQLAEKYGIKL
ncbi:Uncharacterised protein [uncultured archaeon]|nr:Uncharacterised protein [uncultured archaeon]